MTGVQAIVPLDDDEQGLNTKTSKSQIVGKHQQEDAAAASKSKVEEAEEKKDDDAGEKSSTVLSDELREQFETMKAVWRQARRPSANDLGEEADGSLSSSEAAQYDDGDEVQEELRRKQRDTAVETALAVDAEISRWKNGISELEAMLAEEDDSSRSDESEEGEQLQNNQQHQGQDDAGRLQQQELAPYQIRQHQEVVAHPPLIRFPILPAVVVDDDEYDSSDT